MTKGVTIRTYPSGKKAIQIAFTFRGIECRETLKGIPANKTNQKYAANLRGAILDKIHRGTFDYSEFFPNSPRAMLFGHAQAPTVKEAQAGLITDQRFKSSHPDHSICTLSPTPAPMRVTVCRPFQPLRPANP